MAFVIQMLEGCIIGKAYMRAVMLGVMCSA